jgi:hypothetical protein
VSYNGTVILPTISYAILHNAAEVLPRGRESLGPAEQQGDAREEAQFGRKQACGRVVGFFGRWQTTPG